MITPSNRQYILLHLFEYQLNMIGRTLKEANENDNWILEWSLSEEQFLEFKRYAIPLLKKVFKFNTSKANSTLNFFVKHFGLKIK